MDANAERAGSRVHRDREGQPVEEYLCIRKLRFCSLKILQLAFRVYPRARNPHHQLVLFEIELFLGIVFGC